MEVALKLLYPKLPFSSSEHGGPLAFIPNGSPDGTPGLEVLFLGDKGAVGRIDERPSSSLMVQLDTMDISFGSRLTRYCQLGALLDLVAV